MSIADAPPFEGEAANYMMLALWCSGYGTADIAHALLFDERDVAKRMPELLQRRRCLQLQQVA